MEKLVLCLLLGSFSSFVSAQGGVITVGQFLGECRQDMDPCIAFVMGVVEGARHQTRERLNAQPYAFLVHGKPVCLPSEWNSQNLTSVVLSTLESQPHVHQYSAVSGVVYALATESNCQTS
ncbi:MAG: Rap1a/Tai family immunity protein [Pseudomonadota bacterium]|nr:Rap1a/Tai family immunity protein [Pseudomonadota bacterium]